MIFQLWNFGDSVCNEILEITEYFCYFGNNTSWQHSSPVWNHRTVTRTGIRCKKIPCYMRDSACKWLMVKNVKIFRIHAKHFLIFPRERNCRILIGLCNYVFMNHPIMFVERHNKRKLVPASFSYFFVLTVVTLIISLHYKETN